MSGDGNDSLGNLEHLLEIDVYDLESPVVNSLDISEWGEESKRRVSN